MEFSGYIISACFIAVVVIILTGKMNRAHISMLAAVIVYFVLMTTADFDYGIIVELMFGTNADNFTNLHSLILIIGMMIIIQIAHEAGVFQFLGLKLIQSTKGSAIRLLVTFCALSVLIASILNNLLAVIIFVPLTITVSRILNINPSPYILTQAILVNLGASMFSISSIPNILITTYTGITFIEFFLNVGIISIICFILTVLFYVFLYKKEISIPKENLEILMEFNVWNVVQDKKLMYKSSASIFAVMILFVLIPQEFVPPDIIALSVAIITILVSKLDAGDVLKKIDIEMVFYLIGIFIITGAMELTGVMETLAQLLTWMASFGNLMLLIFILWGSGILSSAIDNIPITKVLIPVVAHLTSTLPPEMVNASFYSLAIGGNWGDNLTPMGDNILVVTIAEKNKRSIDIKLFTKLGIASTVFQFIIVSVFFTYQFDLILGIMVTIAISSGVLILFLISRFLPGGEDSKINRFINKLRKAIVT